MRPIRPLANRVLVQPRDRITVSPGGIHIPDTAKDKPMEGKVVACGRDACDVEVGTTVFYRHFAGVPLEYDGGPRYLMVEEDEIVAAEDLRAGS